MIELRRMTPGDRPAVQSLEVSPAQHAFVDPIGYTLNRLKAGEDCHLVVAGEQAVGFFIIDRHYSDRYAYAASDELGLQEYFIDARFQGKGYGKATVLALPGHLADNYPARSALVLTVNCRNILAYGIYLTGGFADGGALYHGGRSGPQHILRLALSDPKTRD